MTEAVKEILVRYSPMENTYENCEAMKAELEQHGYTLSYDLDAQVFNVRKIRSKVVAVAGMVVTERLVRTASQTPVIVVEHDVDMITLAGKQYVRVETPPSPSRRALTIPLMAMALMYGTGSRVSAAPDVHIESEFELIQQKKSKLSRSQRDWVVQQFFKKYREYIV
jgi:hypothetical protein